MSKTRMIKLNGGPAHGQFLEVEKGTQKIYVAKPNKTIRELRDMGPEDISMLDVKEGLYSHVVGSKSDFEWDGWIND